MNAISKVLFIPSLKKGNGTGHFRRCLGFCNYGSVHGRIYMPLYPQPGFYSFFELSSQIPGFSKDYVSHDIDDSWDCIVLDQRKTSVDLLALIPPSTYVIALDEGRPSDSMDYLLDLIPAAGKRKVNSFDPLMGIDPEIPAKQNGKPCNRKILVTFGGEDVRDLTSVVLSVLVQSNSDPERLPCDLTVVRGPLFRKVPDFPGVKVVANPEKLSRKLHEYDLVITSFGITSLEASRARVPVVHINPTRYHTRLSHKSGFPVAGTGRVQEKRLIDEIEKAFRESAGRKYTDGQSMYFPDFLAELSLTKMSCPACGGLFRRVMERYPDRSFFQCRSCAIVYQQRVSMHSACYHKEYFFEGYQKQYGKTYLEDFDHIAETGMRRCSHILNLLPNRESPRLLADIGCAYGPFLKAAADSGFNPSGLDISQDAVDYVTGVLGYPAYCVSFPEEIPGGMTGRKYSAVTMWYVIEHFSDIVQVLGTVNSMLETGGLFCFSTPDIYGISGRRDRKKFLEKSPADHVTVWSALRSRKVLKRYGFRVKKTVSTGIHRERFPVWLSWLPGRMLQFFAHSFFLGDTFEIYAEKTEECTE